MGLSPHGRTVAIAAPALLLLAVVTHIHTFAVLGAVGVIALSTATIAVARRADLAVEMRGLPRRTRAPGRLSASLVVTPGRRRRAVLSATVAVDGVPHVLDRVAVRSLTGRPAGVPLGLPELPRGEHTIGPICVRVTDPLELLRRERKVTDRSLVIVHPRRHAMRPVPPTVDHVLDGPAPTLVVPAGHAEDGIHAYAPGHDLRLVHAPATRRRGELMLRRRVAAEASGVTIVLDTCASAYLRHHDFEDAVSIAASLCTATATHDRPITVVSTGRTVRCHGIGPAAIEPALNQLACARNRADDPGLRALPQLLEAAGHTTVVVVTGATDREQAVAGAAFVRRAPLAWVITISEDSQWPVHSGHRVISAANAIDAARRWNWLTGA